ncbi:MAG: hypothetical protein LBH04_12235 [Tannerellaceae bacterium]|nr:hypothetical protein [Tannerellaceae bacterium]
MPIILSSLSNKIEIIILAQSSQCHEVRNSGKGSCLNRLDSNLIKMPFNLPQYRRLASPFLADCLISAGAG